MGWLFGYGSLVNHHTHDQRPVAPARLTGWAREWCGTDLRPAAFLSVCPAKDSRIEGLLAPVADWRALDAREYAYGPQQVSPESPAQGPARIYRILDQHRADPAPDSATDPHPILLSYLDVVTEGYLHHFGAPGVAAFFASTRGWDRPIEDDRAAPQYPRHRPQSRALRALVDHHLSRL